MMDWGSKRTGATVPPVGALNGRRLRIQVGIAAVFATGIALGTVFGGWIVGQEVPRTQVSLASPPPPPLEVRVRAYRPPTRGIRPAAPPAAAAPKPPSPPAAAPEIDLAPAAAAARPARRAAWLANAAPSQAAAGRPMIAIVIDDLGIAQTRTRRAIALPAPITLAFIPYGRNLRQLASAGRARGHELMVHVNMEPKNRDVDAGPRALVTGQNRDEIRAGLDWALTRFDGFVGINNHMGSRFTEWPEGVEVVLRELRGRGLLFFDSVTSQQSVGAALARALDMAYATRDVFLDNIRSPEKIALQLAETERIARRRGYAIAIGHPHDVTIDALAQWIPAVKKRGFLLVPLSAIVRRRMGEG